MAQLDDNNALLIYRVGPVLCCAPTLPIVTIISPPHLTHPPGTNSSHPGIFKHGNMLVNVVDVRVQFGVKESDWSKPGRIVITLLNNRYYGFHIDQVIDVIHIPGSGWGQLSPQLSGGVFTRSLTLDSAPGTSNTSNSKKGEKIHLYAEFEKLQNIRVAGFLKPYIEHLQLQEEKCATDKSDNEPAKGTHKSKQASQLEIEALKSQTKINPPKVNTEIDEKINSATDHPVNVKQHSADSTDERPHKTKSDKAIDSATVTQLSVTKSSDALKDRKDLNDPESLSITRSHSSNTEIHTDKKGTLTSTSTSTDTQNKSINSSTGNKTPRKKTATLITPTKTSIADTKNHNNIEKKSHINKVTDQRNSHPVSSADTTTFQSSTASVTEAEKKFEPKTTSVKSNHINTANPTSKGFNWLTGFSSLVIITLLAGGAYYLLLPNEEKKKPYNYVNKPVNTYIPEQSEKQSQPEAVTTLTLPKDQDEIPDITNASRQADSDSTTDNKSAITDINKSQTTEPYRARIETNTDELTIVLTTPGNESAFNEVVDSIEQQQESDLQKSNELSYSNINVQTNKISNPITAPETLKTTIKKQVIQEVVHTVIKGDTLWHITKRYVHNPYRYPELARINKIRNPDLIYPEQKVRIIHVFTNE